MTEASPTNQAVADNVAAPTPDANDVEQNKAFAMLAYFLFFLPMISAKDSKFAMYHANQGLNLFLFTLGVNVIGMLVPIIGWFLVIPLGNMAVCVFLVMGLINASQGQEKPLPVIGKFKLLS